MNNNHLDEYANEIAAFQAYVQDLKILSRLTQVKMAGVLGVGRATLCRWLAGTHLPNLTQRKALKAFEESLRVQTSPEDAERLRRQVDQEKAEQAKRREERDAEL